jgi:hypothetical protein
MIDMSPVLAHTGDTQPLYTCLPYLKVGSGTWVWNLGLELGTGTLGLELGTGTWDWNLGLELGTGTWDWNLGLELGTGTLI